MDISRRETTEWLNYWIEDANKCKQRIILIGDSVTRDIRKRLSFYAGGYCVDLLAMSYSILDDMVMEEICHFFEKMPYKYDCIIYHIGAHHGYNIECVQSEEAAGQYKDRTKKILCLLKKYSTNVKVMSLTFEGCTDEESGLDHNAEIKKRNEILKIVSEELDLIFFDLNRKMNYKTIQYIDRCHFADDDYEYISKLILEYFFPEFHFSYSNRVREINELNKMICMYANIYVYGNGIRGKAIKMYLKKYGYTFSGFIVSDEYSDLYDNVSKINEIEKENTLVIVTPMDITIWERLEEGGFDYISLGSDIYAYLNEEIIK